MSDVALIIQGPLVSRGNTGRTIHVPAHEFRDEYVVSFDCRDNIKEIVARYGHLFGAIVLSTWDTELLPSDVWPKQLTVVAAPDPGGIARGKQGIYKLNNKYRQFIGIRNGLRYLEEIASIKHVIRIRTDQFLDLERLCQSYEKSRSLHDKRIFVPYMRPSAFLLSDLYFASSLSAMLSFCDAVLAYDCQQFIESVHREMVLKHAHVVYTSEINVPDEAYFPRFPQSGASLETKAIFAYMFKNAYGSLDPDVLRSVVWRGHVFSDAFVATELGDCTSPPDSKHVPLFISTNWKLFYEFRKRNNAQLISTREYLQMSVSLLFWRILIVSRLILRKFLRMLS